MNTHTQYQNPQSLPIRAMACGNIIHNALYQQWWSAIQQGKESLVSDSAAGSGDSPMFLNASSF
jgi:hypothetical protein